MESKDLTNSSQEKIIKKEVTISTQRIIITNDVTNRFLPLTDSVANGLEREAKYTDFKFLQRLGKIGYGEVELAMHKKTSVVYAIEKIDKTKKNIQAGKENFRREVAIMYGLRHPNIARLYSHFEDKIGEEDYCFLVMEYISEGDVYNIMQNNKNKLTLVQKASIIRDLVCAVNYLHSRDPKIIHRDIKPENLLLQHDLTAKLSDFGWSNFLEEDSRNTFCGTPIFMAPEVLNGTSYDHKVDIWSIGLFIYEVLCDRPIFKTSNPLKLRNEIIKLETRILNGDIWPDHLENNAKDLIGKILRLDPTNRIESQEILQHQFFFDNLNDHTEILKKQEEIIERSRRRDSNVDEVYVYVLSEDYPQQVSMEKLNKDIERLVRKMELLK